MLTPATACAALLQSELDAPVGEGAHHDANSDLFDRVARRRRREVERHLAGSEPAAGLDPCGQEARPRDQHLNPLAVRRAVLRCELRTPVRNAPRHDAHLAIQLPNAGLVLRLLGTDAGGNRRHAQRREHHAHRPGDESLPHVPPPSSAQ